jgi:cell wall-associated NlpC family hydrolase
VRAAIAPLLGEPRISASLTSQLLAGEVATVLEQRGDWLRVRGEDDYAGWTHAGYLGTATGDEATWPLSLGCLERDAAPGPPRMMPLGARLAPSAMVLEGDSVAWDARAHRFPARAPAIASSALTLFAGASYLWGGVTPWGCDCSGFVQRSFRLHGVSLPRDAWQQAGIGTELPCDAGAELSAGDLLFFSDRDDKRVTHVGIALGSSRMVHSSLSRGGVALEQMNGDDPYVVKLRAGCTGVRRVL